MFAEERKSKIVYYVHENSKATVQELCEKFNVSSATIRNDLRDLERAGALLRTHGGAMGKTKTGFEPFISERTARDVKEKATMAEIALEYIEDGDTVIIDTGTTTYELARLLHYRRGLTVVTNDLKIAIILEDNDDCNLIMLGGVVRKKFYCTIGNPAIALLNELSVDKAFMVTNSFSIEKGASTPDLAQAEVKKKMIEIAARVYLLCDSSKLNKSSFVQFARPDQIDVLITETIDNSRKTLFEESGFKVISHIVK